MVGCGCEFDTWSLWSQSVTKAGFSLDRSPVDGRANREYVCGLWQEKKPMQVWGEHAKRKSAG